MQGCIAISYIILCLKSLYHYQIHMWLLQMSSRLKLFTRCGHCGLRFIANSVCVCVCCVEWRLRKLMCVREYIGIHSHTPSGNGVIVAMEFVYVCLMTDGCVQMIEDKLKQLCARERERCSKLCKYGAYPVHTYASYIMVMAIEATIWR